MLAAYISQPWLRAVSVGARRGGARVSPSGPPPCSRLLFLPMSTALLANVVLPGPSPCSSSYRRSTMLGHTSCRSCMASFGIALVAISEPHVGHPSSRQVARDVKAAIEFENIDAFARCCCPVPYMKSRQLRSHSISLCLPLSGSLSLGANAM